MTERMTDEQLDELGELLNALTDYIVWDEEPELMDQALAESKQVVQALRAERAAHQEVKGELNHAYKVLTLMAESPYPDRHECINLAREVLGMDYIDITELMTERITDEQLNDLEWKLNDLASTPEKEIKIPVPVQEASALGLILVAALRAERDVHQATQAELELYRTHGDDLAGAIEEYISDGNDSRLIYAQELYNTARARQGEGAESE